jgi:L-arabinose isomerase
MRALRHRNLVKMLHPVPKFPVARVVVAASESQSRGGNLDFAGGAHHTSCSFSVTPEYLRDFAEMAGIEFLLIDENTRVDEFKECFER